MAKLSPKQDRFVAEYLVDLNATQAAIRAGYSQKTASQQGRQLLQKTSVSAAIQEAQAKLANKLEITTERVLQEYARIAFSDLRDYVVFEGNALALKSSHTLTNDQARAIAEISETQHGLRFKLHDKKGALDSIAKHLGMFVDRHEHSGPDGGPIQHRDASLDELTDEELAAMAQQLATEVGEDS